MQKWIKYDGRLYNITLASELLQYSDDDLRRHFIYGIFNGTTNELFCSKDKETVSQAFIRIQNFLDHDNKSILEL